MLNYFKSMELPIGKLSEFKDIISELCKDRSLTNDPVQFNTLKVIFPPQFLSKLTDVSTWREVDSWAPEHIDNQVKIDDKITKTEIFIRGNVVYKREHILEIFQTMPFVCGFINHKNVALQSWRAL